MTDDRNIMSLMKPLTNTLKILDSNTFKNVIIVFGVALSLFTITSFDHIAKPDVTSMADEIIQTPNDAIMNNGCAVDEKTDNQSIKKVKTHHNFIASYFLQESSVKRERKKSDEGVDAISHLIQLQKIIISHSLSLF